MGLEKLRELAKSPLGNPIRLAIALKLTPGNLEGLC